MRLENYPLAAMHVFQVRTLRALGFETRVSLFNKSNTDPRKATAYDVDVSVYDESGRLATTRSGVAHIEPGGFVQLECAEFVRPEDGESIVYFHLIPLRLKAASADGRSATIDMGELMYLLTAQDQHVEYYREDGYASGVLYISGPMNLRANPDRTTMIQAPKVYVGRTLTTYLSLMNTSPERDYATVAEMKCRLSDERGRIVARWTEELGPFRSKLVDLRAKLGAASAEFFTFHGLCQNASLIPLTMNFDATRGTLAVEHSLPPTYYGSAVKGPVRASVIEALSRSELFA
jgi:hypothetical protein